jgi:hypothetical protein
MKVSDDVVRRMLRLHLRQAEVSQVKRFEFVRPGAKCDCLYLIPQLSTLTLTLSLPGRGKHEQSECG